MSSHQSHTLEENKIIKEETENQKPTQQQQQMNVSRNGLFTSGFLLIAVRLLSVGYSNYIKRTMVFLPWLIVPIE